MKSILTVIFSFLFIVSGFSQTRNVVVDTNGVVVQPTNIWTANATNARAGLGLGSAATNPASAFQPASTVLSNLASNNGASLTNIAVSNVVGALATNGNAINLTNFPDSLLRTNGNGFGLTNLNVSNITGTLSLASGGTGATNASDARNNLGLGTAATNPATSFQPSSSVLSNLASGNGINLTNIQATNIVGTISVTNIAGSSYSNNIQNFVSDVSNATNTVTNSRNVTVYSIFPTVNTITNTIQLPTNNAIVGDLAKIIHTGPTNSFTRIRKIGEITNLVTLNQSSESVDFIYDGTNWSILPNNSQTTPIYFSGDNATSNAAISRINLGFGWSALTNSNAGTSLVSVDSNGSVVSPTNFWQAAPIASNLQTIVQTFSPTTNSTNAATNGRNVYVYSLATNVSGITNTVTLPTNAATINGDNITVVHQGLTNTTTAIRKLGQTNNLITINNFDEAVKFIYENGDWSFYHNISFVDPIQFSGTNASANAAASRTNLGLGATWLTNTNVTNFRTAIGLGVTNRPLFNGVVVGDTANNPTTAFIANSQSDEVHYAPDGITFYSQTNASHNIDMANAAFNNANTWTFNSAIGFGNTTNAAATRTNLGLGETNFVHFDKVRIGSNSISSYIESDNNLGFNFVISGTPRFRISYSGSNNPNSISLDGQDWALAFGTNNTNGAAITRTNLGLGSTNDVTFSSVTLSNGTRFPINGGFWEVKSSEFDLNFNYVFLSSTSTVLKIEHPNRLLLNFDYSLGFSTNNTNGAAATRTNLGLGATNDVTFGRLYISNTNVGAFEGLANLINSNNTTLSNETLFRVGLAEATNRSAQFGFRVSRTNNGGEGLAVFSVYGYNALMMIGPSDRSRTNTATNAGIEADIFSISDTNKVMTLVTTNTGATLFHRPIEFNNTTNQAVTRTNIGLGGGITTNIDVKLDNNAGMRLYFNNGILTNSVTPIP